MTFVLFALLLALLALGLPIAVALAASSMLTIAMDGTLPLQLTVHRMVAGVDSFPLIAIPFFIFAGSLMNAAGITDRLFDFARAGVGWMRGGLAQVNIGTSVIFAGMSGTAVADAGGLGTIEIRAMTRAGYEKDFAIAVTAASSVIGPVIPPSLTLVVFGVLASTSIGQLFLAGIIPGLLMAVSLMLMVRYYAVKRGYPRDGRFSLRRLLSTFRRAFLSLLLPVIIIGGILSGVFTPTEAAVAGVAYALVLGCLVYRTVGLRSLVHVTMETIETTAIVLFIVASAALFAWLLSNYQVAAELARWILGVTDSRILILLGILVILLIVGCFMEPIAAMTILVPVVLPITNQIGVDPVQLGMIFVLALMIGLLTPPVGLVLHVLARVSDTSFERCIVATMPFLVPLGITLLLVTFIPELSLLLPTLFLR